MIKEEIININDDRIYGKLYLPDNMDKRSPLVILSHGLSLNHTFMKAYAEKLLQYNIASYIYDFRGGGYDCKSSGKISDMTIDTEKEDLITVLNHFKNKDSFNKIYLAGHSQGALVTSLIAPSVESDIDGLFLFAPAYVIPDDMKEEIRREKNVLNLMPEHLNERYISCAKNIDVYDEIIPFDKKVYIFHGNKDLRVPIEYSKKADKIYPNSLLIIYDDEHRFTDENKDKVVNIIKNVIFDE